jgi:2-(1,2-epoxy-1,2-dihydrophenyl)acetyl-CoA isomerase
MEFSSILYSVSDGIATITLNNPSKLNPLSHAIQVEMREALARIRSDASVRALMITGAGKAFCVGADLGAMGSAPGEGRSRGNLVADSMHETSNRVITDLQELPVPVISVVNGPAAGAGVGIALAADIVIAGRSAYFYLPFMAKLGIVPDLGTTWFLSRFAGRARALGLTLLGDKLSAEQAAAWGLIWACVEDAELADQGLAIARRLADLPAHAALETRAVYDAAQTNDLTAQLAFEAERQRELLDRDSFVEGARAFMEKRAPAFTPRGQ